MLHLTLDVFLLSQKYQCELIRLHAPQCAFQPYVCDVSYLLNHFVNRLLRVIRKVVLVFPLVGVQHISALLQKII